MVHRMRATLLGVLCATKEKTGIPDRTFYSVCVVLELARSLLFVIKLLELISSEGISVALNYF